MSQYDHHQIPVAYPPSEVKMDNQQGQGGSVPPLGYPTAAVSATDTVSQKHDTRSRGDGFWKGCCAALCCCCVLDACF